MPTWDASLYLKFSAERTRPALDLVARVPDVGVARVADLGCGPGNSTAVVRARWPAAHVTGVDSSPAMIAAATEAHSAGRWVLADLTTFAETGFDLVFSNAALQWVPDHARVFPHLLGLVRPGGVLAVQVPLHHRSRLHALIAAVADRPAWRDRLAAAKALLGMEPPEFYYDVLRPHAASVDVWATEYQHPTADAAAVIEWIRGTGLRPYLEALADDRERADFTAALQAEVEAAYPLRSDGRILFPYTRLFVVAQASG